MNRTPAGLKILAIFILMVLTAPYLQTAAATPYTPKTLFLTVYADGNTVVRYAAAVDTNLPRVSISLFGQIITDMLVTNGQTVLLDYIVKDGVAAIDTLGYSEVNILYTTPDLVGKEGSVWTLRVEAPMTFSVKFPKEATIIGISSIPVSITSVDNQYILTMNMGRQNISYSTGVVGTKEQATINIENARITVDQSRSSGVSVKEAEEELLKAKQAYDQGQYVEAEQAASKAKRIAEQALIQPVEPAPQQFQNLLLISWAVTAVAVGVSAFLLIRRRRGSKTVYEKEVRVIDVTKILQRRPHLRLEDREAVQYMADGGGEVFESEIREKFKLPKTTVWRMVRRLQREGVAEVRKVGGQNLIRLKEEDTG